MQQVLDVGEVATGVIPAGQWGCAVGLGFAVALDGLGDERVVVKDGGVIPTSLGQLADQFYERVPVPVPDEEVVNVDLQVMVEVPADFLAIPVD